MVEPIPLVPAPSQTVLLPARSASDASRFHADARPTRWKTVSALLSVALILALGVATRPLFQRASATDSFWRPVVDANGPVLISVGSVVAMVNGNAVAPRLPR